MTKDCLKPKNKKFLSVCFFIFCFYWNSFGQTRIDSIPIKKNTLYAEFLGNCIYGSINYDRIVFHKKRNKVSLRVGFLPYPKVSTLASATFEVSYINGYKHNLEYSLGLSYLHVLSMEAQYNSTDYIATGNLYLFPHLGYRFQKPEGGFFLRVGIGANIKFFELYQYTPTKHDNTFPQVNSHVWFGFGLGYTFKSSKK